MTTKCARRVVLVVADDWDMGMAMADGLAIGGFAVRSAYTEVEALRELQEHARPSLVVVDMVLAPSATVALSALMTSAEALGIPVLEAAYADEMAYVPRGVKVLRRPFTLDELLAAVARCGDGGGVA